MKLPKTNKRDSANAECKKFKHLTDREGEVYFIGLSRGFEQAKAMMLAEIKKKQDEIEANCPTAEDLEAEVVKLVLEELEGELKNDSASKEADTSNGLEGELDG